MHVGLPVNSPASITGVRFSESSVISIPLKKSEVPFKRPYHSSKPEDLNIGVLGIYQFGA